MGLERRQDQDVRADRHALGMRGDIAHQRRDLQHLQRVGQPVMRQPQRGEAGVARGTHLLDHLGHPLADVKASGNWVLMNRPTFMLAPFLRLPCRA